MGFFWQLKHVTNCSWEFSISFLLARHKAAIDVYNEAAKLSERDWVSIDFFVNLDNCFFESLGTCEWKIMGS